MRALAWGRLLRVSLAPSAAADVAAGMVVGGWGRWPEGAGPWLAFVITTVVFAFAHFELVRAPLLFVIAIPIGLARLITGRLGASIAAHAVNNLLPGIALYLMLVGVPLPAPA